MKVLCIVAHPDDEVLGAGATLAGHVLADDEVDIVFLTDGVVSRTADGKKVRMRREMAMAAAIAIGVHRPIFIEFADQSLDTVGLLPVVKTIESIVADVKPSIIYTHHIGDLNLDHAICARAVLTACRPLPNSSVKAVYAMEVLSSTEWAPERPFIPNRFVNLTLEMLKRKSKAIQAYETELRDRPHARSWDNIENLTRLRGASVGLYNAEAFMTVREIVS